jgi:hypothetical protein
MARSFNSKPLWSFTYPDGNQLVLTLATNPGSKRVGVDLRVRTDGGRGAFGEGVRFGIGDTAKASTHALDGLIEGLLQIRQAIADGTLSSLLPAGEDELPGKQQGALFEAGAMGCERCDGTGWAPGTEGGVVSCACRKRMLAAQPAEGRP